MDSILRMMAEAADNPQIPNKDITRAIPDASGIIDEDGRYVQYFTNSKHLVPPQFSSPQEMIGRTVMEMLSWSLAEQVMNMLRATLNADGIVDIKLELNAKAGERLLEGRAVRANFYLGGKRVIAFCLTDVTDCEQQEKIWRSRYEMRRRSDIVSDLIRRRITTREAIVLARTIDFNLLLHFSLYVFVFPGLRAPEYSNCEGKSYIRSLHDEMIDLLAEKDAAVIWGCGDIDIGLLSPRPKATDDTKQDELLCVRDVLAILKAKLPQLDIYAGIAGSAHSLNSLEKRYRQALSAAEFAMENQRAEKCCHFLDMGIYQLLASLQDNIVTTNYVDNLLGRLVEYDRLHGMNFVETLEWILSCNSLNTVAKKLYVHPKTILFRKRRIETILGVSLDQFDTKVALDVALKIWKLKKKS